MALSTHPVKLLPLLLAGSMATTAYAQNPVVALLKPTQSTEPLVTHTAKGTSLESILQTLKAEHNVFFLYRSELIKGKFVNMDSQSFRNWEEKLNYAITASGLQLEKTRRNIFIISAPKNLGTSLQTIGAPELPISTNQQTFAGSAVTVAVQGQVKGSDNVGIPGVTVVVKGTTNGTSTDGDGRFTLNLPDASATLVFSAIGYVGQEIALQGRTTLDVMLQTDVKALEEVVVVGYQTQRKVDLTGAVALVNQRDIVGIPVGGVDQILQGKAAGVNITQATGAPGAAIAVRIRGIGTINDNDPLYIIDGVPTKDGINLLSPNDIESINVLKDASSAAIYGARASNGVVIVTTKRGKSGKPKLSVSSYAGVQTAANLTKMASAEQYVNAYNTAANNDNPILTALGQPTRPLITPQMAAGLPNVNWLKEVLQPASQYNAQLDVSGGTENSQYIVSASYFNQRGMIINSAFDRFILRTGISSNLSKYIRIGTNVNLTYTKTQQVGSSGDGYGDGNPGASIVRYALFRTPQIPVRNAQGQYTDLPHLADGTTAGEFFGNGLNPVALANATDRKFNNYALLGNAYLELTPIERLRIRSDFGTTFRIVDFRQFASTFGLERIWNTPSSLGQSNSKQFDYNWTNTAIYDLPLGKSTFNFLLGTEAIKRDNQSFSASRQNYVNQDPSFQYLDNGVNTTAANGGGETRSALLSGFARVSYNYNDRYLASFNFRRDGTSQFIPGRRAESFFSGSAGWNLAQEKFMRNLTAFSQLKLRASVGQLGNSQIGDFPYASFVRPSSYYPFGGVSTQGASVATTGNTALRWEHSTQTNVGLDAGLLGGALTVTLDYFVKNTSRVLLTRPLPPSGGRAGEPYVNAGTVRNSGLELQLNYQHAIGKDWSYSLSGNLATVHNEVTSLDNLEYIAAGRIDNGYFATRTQVGQPIGSFYLLQTDGIFQNAQEVFTSATPVKNVQPGDVKYKDLSGPDGVPDGKIDDYDRTFVGSPFPKLNYGFTANARYKNFDLTLFFQGVYGNKIYSRANMDIEGFYRSFNLTERAATNYWNGEGSSNTDPRLSWQGAANNTLPSTRFLEDGSYLRLKNLQIGYTLGDKLREPLHIASLRIYGSIQNLLTFTKYNGLDPELSVNNNSLGDGELARGIDWGNYPSSRTFTVGVTAGF